MTTPDREEWLADEPPHDFANGVMERIAREANRAPTARRSRAIIAGALGAMAMVGGVTLAVAWRGAKAPTHGEALAADRTQTAIGARAIAVLERGAHVRWTGDDVSQTAGDVFYRVEPGGSFTVHTPAGDVAVLGTCFRVRLDRTEDDVNGRDVKAGVVGAAFSAAALVTVYEGKVALSRGRQTVTLTAGEAGRADGDGAQLDAAGTRAGAGAAGSAGDDALVAANANLAESVREYKTRLEAIEAQKTSTEGKLAEAVKQLALATSDGQAAPAKSIYDVSQDDWKKLAEQGSVVARYPCGDGDAMTVGPDSLESMGLPRGDAPAVAEAYKQSAARIWAVVRPLCVQALQGNAALADRLGADTCQGFVTSLARQSGEDTDEETRKVAEIRAGMIPMPTDPKVLGSHGAILYAESGEAKAIEQQLTQAIGPDDARALIYGERSNMCSGDFSVGPRNPAKGSLVVTGSGTQGP